MHGRWATTSWAGFSPMHGLILLGEGERFTAFAEARATPPWLPPVLHGDTSALPPELAARDAALAARFGVENWSANSAQTAAVFAAIEDNCYAYARSHPVRVLRNALRGYALFRQPIANFGHLFVAPYCTAARTPSAFDVPGLVRCALAESCPNRCCASRAHSYDAGSSRSRWARSPGSIRCDSSRRPYGVRSSSRAIAGIAAFVRWRRILTIVGAASAAGCLDLWRARRAINGPASAQAVAAGQGLRLLPDGRGVPHRPHQLGMAVGLDRAEEQEPLQLADVLGGAVPGPGAAVDPEGPQQRAAEQDDGEHLGIGVRLSAGTAHQRAHTVEIVGPQLLAGVGDALQETEEQQAHEARVLDEVAYGMVDPRVERVGRAGVERGPGGPERGVEHRGDERVARREVLVGGAAVDPVAGDGAQREPLRPVLHHHRAGGGDDGGAGGRRVAQASAAGSRTARTVSVLGPTFIGPAGGTRAGSWSTTVLISGRGMR